MSQSCLQQLQMVTSVKIPAGVLNRTGLSRSSLGEIRQAELLNVSLTEIAVSSSVLRFVNPSADFSTQSCFRHPPPPLSFFPGMKSSSLSVMRRLILPHIGHEAHVHSSSIPFVKYVNYVWLV